MAIEMPKQKFYFYDEGDDGSDVLYCWLPYKTLESMTKRSNSPVDINILRDFPRGLELEISDQAIKQYDSDYGLRPSLPIPKLIMAFESLKRKAPDKDPWIRASAVEKVARAISDSRVKDWPPIKTVRQVRLLMGRKASIRADLENGFIRAREEIIRRQPTARAVADKKIFDRPKMTGSESPRSVMSRLQRQTKGGT
jgi:hypothetical protein